MRRVLLALVIGCGVPPPAVESPAEPADLIDPATFATKLSALRATLARHQIELEPGPSISSCTALDARGCVHCEIARREATAGVDPDLIDGIAIAFAHYKPSVLAAAELQRVALCSKIRFDHDAGKAPAGLADIGDHRILISIEHFRGGLPDGWTIEQVVHHELFHLLDHAKLIPRVIDRQVPDKEWEALNPPGFAYRDPAPDEAPRPAGFIDAYATTNDREDRASTFEYLMGQPAQLCEIARVDPVVRAKATLVWKRIAPIVGADLLRREARCVDWIDGKPAAKPAPKPAKPTVKPAPKLQLPPKMR